MAWNSPRSNHEATTAARSAGPATHSIALTELDSTTLDPGTDVRGYHVYSSEGKMVGRVEALLGDCGDRELRFLGIAMADPQYGVITGRVMVPIGGAGRPGDRRIVMLGGITASQLACAPRLSGWRVTREEQDATLAAYGMATSRDVPSGALYDGANFDVQRMVGTQRPPAP